LLDARKIIAQGFKSVHSEVGLQMELYYTRQASAKPMGDCECWISDCGA
jgi:hypothetical protein